MIRILRLFQKWGVGCAVLSLVGLVSCGENKSQSAENQLLDIKILNWTDSSGWISKKDILNKFHSEVLPNLPVLEVDNVPALYVRGSLRTDEQGSVMILEARFLFGGSNVPAKVIIMGSVEGTTEKKRKRLLSGVLQDMKSGLASNIRICNGNHHTWIAALNSPEADEQILALKLLKNQGKSTAAPEVINLLNDPRSEVGVAATETAAVLANRAHVAQIIDIAKTGGIEVEARCVQVLSRIGGADAIAYLEMLAVGHENPQLRELSFNALKRLK